MKVTCSRRFVNQPCFYYFESTNARKISATKSPVVKVKSTMFEFFLKGPTSFEILLLQCHNELRDKLYNVLDVIVKTPFASSILTSDNNYLPHYYFVS